MATTAVPKILFALYMFNIQTFPQSDGFPRKMWGNRPRKELQWNRKKPLKIQQRSLPHANHLGSVLDGQVRTFSCYKNLK